MKTAFFAHAPADHERAKQFSAQLEFSCSLTCYVEDGMIRAGQDLVSKMEEGLSADVLVLLLSPASSPAPWILKQWEPILNQAKRDGVEVVTVLVRECPFPTLLRRRNFIDATSQRLIANRLLKRWFWHQDRHPKTHWNLEVSAGLEDLYGALSDRAGALQVSGASASRFAREAAQEFESVIWVPCQGRSLAQCAGHLAHQLGATFDGPLQETCGLIRDLLAAHRCLVVLDAPDAAVRARLTAAGRTSTAITSDPVEVLETPRTPGYARQLVATRRYAEAYELLYALLDDVVDPDGCTRELAWICEHWGRVNEANLLRSSYPSGGGEQLALF